MQWTNPRPGTRFTSNMNGTPRSQDFRLCFEPFYGRLMPYEFPCDARGHVDLDAFDDDTRLRYLYARALIGLDYRIPRIEPARPT